MSDELDRKPVDWWTLVHLAYGTISGYYGVPFMLVMGLALIFESAENWNRPDSTIFGFNAESNLNIAVDLGVTALGWFVGARLANL